MQRPEVRRTPSRPFFVRPSGCRRSGAVSDGTAPRCAVPDDSAARSAASRRANFSTGPGSYDTHDHRNRPPLCGLWHGPPRTNPAGRRAIDRDGGEQLMPADAHRRRDGDREDRVGDVAERVSPPTTVLVAGTVDPTERVLGLRLLSWAASPDDTAVVVTTTEGLSRTRGASRPTAARPRSPWSTPSPRTSISPHPTPTFPPSTCPRRTTWSGSCSASRT